MGEPTLRRALRAAVTLVALFALTGVALDARAADPGAVCQRRVLFAAKRLYQQSYSCWSRAYRNLTFDPFSCLTKAEDRFRTAYDSAATKAVNSQGQCGLRMNVDTLLSIVAGDVDPFVDAIAGNVDFANKTDRNLRASRMSASGAFVRRAFDAEIGFTRNANQQRLTDRIANATKLLDSSFSRALSSSVKHGIVYDGIGPDTISESLGASAGLWERMTRSGNGAFSVSGTVFAADATFDDSDVNDTSTTPAPNNSITTAQPLPVPSTVGGYVNLAHTGPNGNSFVNGDAHDLYLVSLRAGQVIVLVLGDDPSTVDLDFCISGQLPEQSACAQGTGSVEMLPVPSDGSYFIDVYPFALCNCGGTYTLSIGQTVPAWAMHAERTDVEFVPGQLIVKLKDTAPAPSGGVSALAVRPKPALPKELGLETLAGDSKREMLVQLPASGAAKTAAFQAMGIQGARAQMLGQSLTTNEVARQETVLAMKGLRKRPEVQSVELNTILHPSAIPDDPYFDLQWHYPLIHLPQAWDITLGDPNVIVAVVDTGVRLDHPDLQGSLVAGYDFISDSTRARDGDGIDPDPNDPGDKGAGAGTSSFHGTHVAGTIAAATNNGIGVAGVAWGARVMPVRVLGVNGGTQYDVLQGVRYAAGLENDSGTLPPKRADIINLSLGGGGASDSAQAVFAEARAAGVIVVAAAGNAATSAPSYPASYDGVVSVAAVDLNRKPAPYSNFGPTVDVAAPGGDTSVDRNGDGYADGVLSTLADDSVSPLSFVYAFYQGTSMATPHVAGVFALMRSVDHNISPATIDSLLQMGALTDDLLTPGRDDKTGYGLINARSAVIAAGATAVDPNMPLSVTPSGLNFGLSIDSLDFIVANAGSDPLTVSSVSVDNAGQAPWLSVTATSVDGNGLGRYTAAVNRNALDPDSYSATIAIVSSHGTVHIPVVMRVGGPTSSDAGFHYVLVVDAQSLVPVDEVPVAAQNGQYPYAFSNIPEGDYLVIAGSDQDNDGLICDGGEACGSYPTLDLPAPISLHTDVTAIDFGTAFRQSIATGASSTSPIPMRGVRRMGR